MQEPFSFLFHPRRVAILHALSQEALTVQTLAERLPEIPQSTLYRMVRAMEELGVLEGEEVARVRGVVERAFRVRPASTLEDGLLGLALGLAMGAALPALNLAPDAHASVQDDVLFVSDAELTALRAILSTITAPYRTPGPDKRRVRMTVALVQDDA